MQVGRWIRMQCNSKQTQSVSIEMSDGLIVEFCREMSERYRCRHTLCKLPSTHNFAEQAILATFQTFLHTCTACRKIKQKIVEFQCDERA